MMSYPDASIVHHFKVLKDPRIERAKTHRLIAIMVIALGSMMVGGDGFQDMELFGQSKREWLASLLNLSNYPEIPWRDMAGMWDVLIHQYTGVDEDIVWKTVIQKIPRLRPEFDSGKYI